MAESNGFPVKILVAENRAPQTIAVKQGEEINIYCPRNSFNN